MQIPFLNIQSCLQFYSPEMRLDFNFSSELMFHVIFLQLRFKQNLKTCNFKQSSPNCNKDVCNQFNHAVSLWI